VDSNEPPVVLHAEEAECIFCSPHGRDQWFDRPIASDGNQTIVVPAVGAFVRGYVLVVPVMHVTATCRIPEQAKDRFSAFVCDVAAHLGRLYGTKITLFEHAGCDSPGRPKSACINHAHLHLVPGSYNLTSESQTSELEVHKSLRDFLRPERRSPYLMFQDPDGPVASFPDHALPQFFRRAIAKRLGIGECWDYALFPFWENVQLTCQDFSSVTFRATFSSEATIENGVST
jgi:diadenosine tetraphosphate (Ap4A) HIT family hydrolase